MRIDSHVCFAELHPPEHLSAILERNRFDGAILVVDAPVLPAMGSHIVGLVVRAADTRALEEYRRHPAFRGLCCSLANGIPDGLEELARLGIPLDVEMRTEHFPLLLEMAAGWPELRMAIDHMARPHFASGLTAEWRQGMEASAGFPQLFCKMSGLLTEVGFPWSSAPMRPFVQHALACFGPKRVMFGSEWPRRLPDAIWKESLAAFTQSIGAQTLEVREQMLGGTARRFYGI